MKHFKVKIFFSLLALATAQHNLFAATIDNPNQAESGPGTVVPSQCSHNSYSRSSVSLC